MTAVEIEDAAAEVGIDRASIRQALGMVAQPPAPEPQPPLPAPSPRRFGSGVALKALMAAWWSAGWTIPLLMLADSRMRHQESIGGFFLGWGIYLGVGVFASTLASHMHRPTEDEKALRKQERRARPRARHEVTIGVTLQQPGLAGPAVSTGVHLADLSRQAVIERLFALQGHLEGQKSRRAFLGVRVVGAADLKRSGSDLAVEFSFGRLYDWMQEVVHHHGGQLHRGVGDGAMACFAEDVGAVRAARALQDGIQSFNQLHNRLPVPFSLQCGIHAGEVPILPGQSLGDLHHPVLDLAAELMRKAEPGGALLSAPLAAAALIEIGPIEPNQEAVKGQTVFAWRGTAGRPIHQVGPTSEVQRLGR